MPACFAPKILRRLLLGLLFCVFVSQALAKDPFAADVRPTDPLTPDQERAALQVPPGFEVQLVASEPEIAKPLNMAFDEQGRLWITDTVEYPYPVKGDAKGRDSIKILEINFETGHAERVTTFADGLNIPIGIYPWRGGAIAFSIPNIWHLHDDNGDGVADRRDVLYGPFDWTRDTHGLNNGFRRAFDGWLHANHGYNNVSHVKGRDGHEVHFASGNTYRMRPDGSRIEHFTIGQVNPFGTTIDPLGNLFTADCHSKPIYQLIRGGRYPTFSKIDDGLGVVPPMMQHLHDSTAISGLAFYAAEHFPPAYRNLMFTGNVMTSRVNCDHIEYHGSTMLAIEEPDFVVSKDPWFRPVDILVGPDGALYIADFYNRIIGHYEVPLDHPQRDRTSGRIWRIVHKGNDSQSKPLVKPRDLKNAAVDELVAELANPNLTSRLLATHWLVDEHGKTTADKVAAVLAKPANAEQYAHALWVLHRTNKLSDEQLATATRNEQTLVRVHAIKILADKSEWSNAERQLAVAALKDSDAFVRRASVDALGLHPQRDQLETLLVFLATVPKDDEILEYNVRLAIRDHFMSPGLLESVDAANLSNEQALLLAEIARSVPSAAAGTFIAHCVMKHKLPADLVSHYAQHVAQYGADSDIAALIATIRKRFAKDDETQSDLLIALQSGLERRGATNYDVIRDWATEVAAKNLAAASSSLGWTYRPLPGNKRLINPWGIEPRKSVDGKGTTIFHSSLPVGEDETGIYRSQTFELPAKISFFLAGHLGLPNNPAHNRNLIRLCDAASNQVLLEALPPRNDVGQKIEWDLSQWHGKSGYLELIDGDDEDAYAWIAAGRFSIDALNPSDHESRLQHSANLIGSMKLTSLKPRMVELLCDDSTNLVSQTALARALVAIDPDTRATALAAVVGEVAAPTTIRDLAARAIAERKPKQLDEVLVEAMKVVPMRLQQAIAEALAADATGAKSLVELVRTGITSPQLLVRPTVKLRLDALQNDDLKQAVAELIKELPSENAELQKLIDARHAGYAKASTSIERGQAAFTKHCAACHQIAGKGILVGPQLDGIGNRGLERLLEDVLDPNRNVDAGFRTTTLVSYDGTVTSALVRREEGSQLVLVDSTGKEFSVAKDDIEEQVKSQVSLMPGNVHELLTEQELYDLLTFLLRQRATVPE